MRTLPGLPGYALHVVLLSPSGHVILIWLLREVNDMLCSYTAKYIRLADGYMGQLVEWPEVVTEGTDLDECRTMLRDALREMVLAYREIGKEIPSNVWVPL